MKAWAYLSDDDETMTIVIRTGKKQFVRMEEEEVKDKLWDVTKYFFRGWLNRLTKKELGEEIRPIRYPPHIQVNEIDRLLEDVWGYELRKYRESGRSVFSEEDRRSWIEEGHPAVGFTPLPKYDS